MPVTKNRNIKILGAVWLGLAGLSFAYSFFGLLEFLFTALLNIAEGFSAFQGEEDGGFIVALLLLWLTGGVIGIVTGLALLRRKPIARRYLLLSSLLFLPSAQLVFPLLVVAPSLWLTLSRGGKKALESYMARGNG